MRYPLTLAMTVASITFCCEHSIAKDRSVQEFQAYAARRITNVDEKQLEAFVKRVDANRDGTISENEFSNRIDAYQEVFKNTQLKPSKRAHRLPDNWLTDFKMAGKASKESGKPIVAMFSASWCGPCKAMIANVYPTDEAMNALKGFVPVYIDSEEKRQLASDNDIRAFPTFVCFNTDGESIDQHVGGGNVEKFMQMLAKFKESAANKTDSK